MAALVLAGCGGYGKAITGTHGAGGTAGSGSGGTAGFLQVVVAPKVNIDLDLLLVIKNSSSTAAMQQKFVTQLPTLMNVLEKLPNGLPNLHIAVVSTDMGAPGDSVAEIGCKPYGDDGEFQSKPRGACVTTTLTNSATFISDVDGQKNFTDPIENVLQCISLLGNSGCGFEQHLAAI
ncbi:MAG TPA: hypothetical protein VGD55_01850, partial [Acidothermaceae bacterium]